MRKFVFGWLWKLARPSRTEELLHIGAVHWMRIGEFAVANVMSLDVEVESAKSMKINEQGLSGYESKENLVTDRSRSNPDLNVGNWDVTKEKYSTERVKIPPVAQYSKEI